MRWPVGLQPVGLWAAEWGPLSKPEVVLFKNQIWVLSDSLRNQICLEIRDDGDGDVFHGKEPCLFFPLNGHVHIVGEKTIVRSCLRLCCVKCQLQYEVSAAPEAKLLDSRYYERHGGCVFGEEGNTSIRRRGKPNRVSSFKTGR